MGNMCHFVEKKKKKKQALCLVQHITTKKPPTIFFQPRPTSNLPIINNYYNAQPPYCFNPSYYSGIESTYQPTWAQ